MVNYDVIIPALNEELTIVRIVRTWLSQPQIHRVFVMVDSQTTDNTAGRADYAGAIIGEGPTGKGQLITAALKKFEMADYIALCDADYSRFDTLAVSLVAPRNPLNHRMRIVIPRMPGAAEWRRGGFPFPFDSVAWAWMSGLRSFPAHMIKGCEFHGFLTETQINKAAERGNYLVDLIPHSGVHAPLRFTPERLRKMEEDRAWGKANGIL